MEQLAKENQQELASLQMTTSCYISQQAGHIGRVEHRLAAMEKRQEQNEIILSSIRELIRGIAVR